MIAFCYHLSVKLIGRDLIQRFARTHRDSRSSLKSWTQAMESNTFKHFVELKTTFGSADQVKPHTVFNISGNKYRLIVLARYLYGLRPVVFFTAGASGMKPWARTCACIASTSST